jgi:hypothetical protein
MSLPDVLRYFYIIIYINQMANNLNGKSSKDVRALLNKKYPTTL